MVIKNLVRARVESIHARVPHACMRACVYSSAVASAVCSSSSDVFSGNKDRLRIRDKLMGCYLICREYKQMRKWGVGSFNQQGFYG